MEFIKFKTQDEAWAVIEKIEELNARANELECEAQRLIDEASRLNSQLDYGSPFVMAAFARLQKQRLAKIKG